MYRLNSQKACRHFVVFAFIAVPITFLLTACSHPVVTQFPSNGRYRLTESNKTSSGKNYQFIQKQGDNYVSQKNKK